MNADLILVASAFVRVISGPMKRLLRRGSKLSFRLPSVTRVSGQKFLLPADIPSNLG